MSKNTYSRCLTEVYQCTRGQYSSDADSSAGQHSYSLEVHENLILIGSGSIRRLIINVEKKQSHGSTQSSCPSAPSSFAGPPGSFCRIKSNQILRTDTKVVGRLVTCAMALVGQVGQSTHEAVHVTCLHCVHHNAGCRSCVRSSSLMTDFDS